MKSTKKILIVEDDASFRQILKYQFEANGHKVTIAQNCKLALMFCQREKPDLLLLDIVLTDELSLDVPPTIQSDPKKFGSPVIIAMSGNLSPHQIRKIRDREKSKIHAFMDKPFEFNDLLQKFRELEKEK